MLSCSLLPKLQPQFRVTNLKIDLYLETAVAKAYNRNKMYVQKFVPMHDINMTCTLTHTNKIVSITLWVPGKWFQGFFLLFYTLQV